MTRLYNAGILGTGSCLPEKILTNADLERVVETSDEWIIKRTGIRERHIIDANVPLAALAAEASRKALEDAGITALDIDLIIAATITPDYLTPSLSCCVQKEIEAANASAFDINAACSGFVYALNVAQQFIENGVHEHILVVSAEALSRVTDYNDRKTCVLFGDGAGAVVVGRVESGMGILSITTGAMGELGHNLTLPCFFINDADKENRNEGMKQVVWMDGSEVFTFASRIMSEATLKVIEGAQLTIEDVDHIFPHQANARIIQNAVKRLKYPIEKVYSNLEFTGNISSASIPVCLDEASKANLLKKGDRIVLVAFGGGLTYGAALLTWSKG